MNRSRTEFSRRTLLRGAGTMLALPFLESLVPSQLLAASASAAKPPLRMGIFSVTGGTVAESWVPKEVGALSKLPSILRPLEGLKDDLLVVSGLCQGGRSDGLNAHEHCASVHLTGAAAVKREGGRLYAGISVDQAAARLVGAQTVLPSLELGYNSNQYSFRGVDASVPTEANPRLVFERMFRGRKPVVPNWSRRSSSLTVAPSAPATESNERSVLDAVLAQANALRRRAGRSDQHKLDAYLESVRAVEKQIAFVESRHQQELLDLASPGPSKLAMPDNLPADVDWYNRTQRLTDRDPRKQAEYIRLMADLMVLAFQTDTTRVCTFAAGSDDCMFPGVVSVGYERHCHTLEHNGNSGRPEDADPVAREALRQIHAWYTAMFAEMVIKMKGIDEGGSTLLDNSMILYTSYMADGGHGRDGYPVLLAGKAGGTLNPGRHVAFEKKAPVANLYAEMLTRMGSNEQAFGEGLTSQYAGGYNGRLPGLS